MVRRREAPSHHETRWPPSSIETRPSSAPQDEAERSQRSAARILCRGAGAACLSESLEKEGVERREALPSSVRAAPLAKRGRLSALHRGFSVPGAVASGREREGLAPSYPAGFRPPSSAPRPALEGRSPIVGTGGCSGPPGSGVTSPARGRRIPPRQHDVS